MWEGKGEQGRCGECLSDRERQRSWLGCSGRGGVQVWSLSRALTVVVVVVEATALVSQTWISPVCVYVVVPHPPTASPHHALHPHLPWLCAGNLEDCFLCCIFTPFRSRTLKFQFHYLYKFPLRKTCSPNCSRIHSTYWYRVELKLSENLRFTSPTNNAKKHYLHWRSLFRGAGRRNRNPPVVINDHRQGPKLMSATRDLFGASESIYLARKTTKSVRNFRLYKHDATLPSMQ